MKFLFKILCILLLIFNLPGKMQVLACDVCGCGGGGVFLGIMPQYKKYFTGIRYHQKRYNSHLGSSTGLLRTREHFSMLEMFAGMRLGKKGQLIAMLPYQWNTQTGSSGQAMVKGMGDVTGMALFQVLESLSLDKNQKMVSHKINVGGGIKLPTGKWRFDDAGMLGQHANFMPGSGSVDFSAMALYQFRHGNWGAAVSTIYKATTANANGFKFGNTSQLAGQAFRNLVINKSFTLTPNIGVLSEFTSKDALQKQPVTLSGGWLVNALTGVEASFKHVSTGLVLQPPIAQNLNQSEVKSLTRMMFYCTIIL